MHNESPNPSEEKLKVDNPAMTSFIRTTRSTAQSKLAHVSQWRTLVTSKIDHVPEIKVHIL